MNLIIVDDEDTTRESLAELVPWDTLGIDAVKTARNGREALRLVDATIPDVLLCDVRMPKMDGIELSHHIRERFPSCEIVFLSGFSDKEYLKSAIQLGAVDYLEKPVDLTQLLAVVGRAIDRKVQHARRIAEMDALRGLLDQNQALIRQEELRAMLSAKESTTVARQFVARCFPNAHENTHWYVAALRFGGFRTGDATMGEPGEKALLACLSAAPFGDAADRYAGCFDESHWLAIHSGQAGVGNWTAWLERIGDALSLLAGEHGFRWGIGTGGPVDGPERLPDAWQKAIKQADRRFYHGTTGIQSASASRTDAESARWKVAHPSGGCGSADQREAESGKMKEINRYIQAHCLENQISIQTIASHAGLSPSHLCAQYRKAYGKTVNEQITQLRIERAKALIDEGRLKTYEIATEIGYSDVNYFSTLFRRHVGCTASEYRERGAHGSSGHPADS